MFSFASRQRLIPVGVRLAAAAFLLVWAPIYWHYWGPTNILFLCDIAVLLGCIGLALQSPLLISSQALAISFVSLFWIFDVSWHLLFGGSVIGGTDYMFDRNYPLWLRLISLYHVVLPLILLWATSRIGYDRRAFRLECGIAAVAILCSRAVEPSLNINFAYTAPILHRQVGSAPVHLVLTFLGTVLILYAPVHFLFRRLFAPPSYAWKQTQMDCAAPEPRKSKPNC
jgi:hypothetical protein